MPAAPHVRAQSGAPAAPFDLAEVTVADLQRRMTTGQDTSRSLTEKYLARIDALDRRGPSLRAVLEINPDALAIADALDRERRTTGARGPLHGIPVLLKDNIATRDQMMTSAGSLALEGVTAPADAFIVGRLRAAGALILGKANLSEWANFRSTHSSSGWSARGGQTRNPYALDRNPSGSSSGSAVAVSANLVALAVGTETDGSIVSPSSVNGVVGIKPTVGLVSRRGIVPIAHSQDTAGPLARTVTDAAVLLEALAGTDPEDPVTSASPPGRQSPLEKPRRRSGSKQGQGLESRKAGWLTNALVADGLRGARIGVVRNRLFGNHAAADALAEQAIALMKARGATIVDPVEIATLGQFDDSELEVLLYEFKADLGRYLRWLGPASPVHSLADVIAFNDAHRDRELTQFGQEIMLRAAKKGPLEDAAYQTALASNLRLSRTMGVDAALALHRLDALVAPTGGPAWLIDLVNGNGGTAAAPAPSTLAAVAGYPHVTVPMGFYQGLPMGLSFIGRAWSEPTLVRLAYAYEQATHHRQPPAFAATAPVP